MDNDFDNKRYKYGDALYSFKEIYGLYKNIPMDRKKLFKDCLAHHILAQILIKGNDSVNAKNVDFIAMMEQKHVEKTFSKLELFFYNKEYSLRIKKLFSLNGKTFDYKINEFINGEWLLNKLVSLTLGSSYDKDEIDDFSLVNYDSLAIDECKAISENFKRNMINEEIVYYKSAKTLSKERINKM